MHAQAPLRHSRRKHDHWLCIFASAVPIYLQLPLPLPLPVAVLVPTRGAESWLNPRMHRDVVRTAVPVHINRHHLRLCWLHALDEHRTPSLGDRHRLLTEIH